MDARRARQARSAVEALCRREVDTIDLLKGAAGALAKVVPYDAWCGLTLDPATFLPTGGYHEEGLPPERLPHLLQIEHGTPDVNLMPDLARSRSGAATIARSSRGRPETSARYREVLEPSGLPQELRAVLRAGPEAWGSMVLLRAEDVPDFSPAETELLASVSRELGRAVRRSLTRREALSQECPPEGPGMLLVRGRPPVVETATEAGLRWMSEMYDGHVGSQHLPYLVFSLTLQAVSYQGREAVARTRTRAGRWLTLTATTLDAGQRTAVMIAPSSPLEIADVVADVYGLSRRENTVAHHVLAGRTTAEIAAELCLSPYTVQDHLKKIFDKIGVRSRAELTSRLFFDQCLPNLAAGLPAAADGWFRRPRA